MTKLHLGCGQKYLKGYINIDFPIENHSVQKTSVADEFGDILKLKYKPKTIDEIRLHHVFEHFERSVAFGLLTNWNRWLKIGGKLRIEVPDFYRNSLIILNPVRSIANKLKAERHVFGSQEAIWAIHFEGYTPQTIKYILEKFGFKIDKIKMVKWGGIYNIDVFSTKIMDIVNTKSIAKELLAKYLVDKSKSEKDLLKIWIKKYEQQVENGRK